MVPPKPAKGNSDLRAMIQAARRKAKQEKENANGDIQVMVKKSCLLYLYYASIDIAN